MPFPAATVTLAPDQKWSTTTEGFKFGQKINDDSKILLLEQLVKLQNVYFRLSK